jgi:sortase (surface protein transpeptidase)
MSYHCLMTYKVQGDATYLSLEIPTNKLNLNIDIMKGINRNNLQRNRYILESYVLQGREPCSL